MLRESIVLLSVLICFVSVNSKPSDAGLKVHELLKLLPKDKIEEIEQTCLKDDEGFRAAVYFLQSKEWRDLVDAVLEKPEYHNFTKMLEKYNIDLPQAISCIRKHVESLKVAEKPAADANLDPFIQKIQAIIPISAIAQALTEKFSNAEAKKLRDEISTMENQKLAEAVHNLPEMAKMRWILKGMQFDVEPYIALVYTFLGWVH